MSAVCVGLLFISKAPPRRLNGNNALHSLIPALRMHTPLLAKPSCLQLLPTCLLAKQCAYAPPLPKLPITPHPLTILPLPSPT